MYAHVRVEIPLHLAAGRLEGKIDFVRCYGFWHGMQCCIGSHTSQLVNKPQIIKTDVMRLSIASAEKIQGRVIPGCWNIATIFYIIQSLQSTFVTPIIKLNFPYFPCIWFGGYCYSHDAFRIPEQACFIAQARGGAIKFSTYSDFHYLIKEAIYYADPKAAICAVVR